MEVKTLEPLLYKHPFFADCPAAYVKVLAGCATNVRYQADEVLCREGEEANIFYMIREGHVAIESFLPGQGKVSIQTLGPGEVFGWSWIIPPYTYDFDARVLEPSRIIALDAVCLRQKCEDDVALGYDLLRRFSAVMVARLRETRMRLLDLYGTPT